MQQRHPVPSPATAPRSLSSLGKAASGVKLGWPLHFLMGHVMNVLVSLASSGRQPLLIGCWGSCLAQGGCELGSLGLLQTVYDVLLW